MKLLGLIICIANFDFNENAEWLKNSFANIADTLLIDSSSPVCPANADIVIDNKYYPGLWNQSVKCALDANADWMLFIASDVLVSNFSALLNNLSKILDRVDIGVYSPSLEPNSRCAYAECKFSAANDLRDVPFIEGFFFLARTSLLKKIYPIPSSNEYGWGVDANLCHISRSCGLRVVIDDGVSIFHPSRKIEHAIDDVIAAHQAQNYLSEELRLWMANNYQFSN